MNEQRPITPPSAAPAIKPPTPAQPVQAMSDDDIVDLIRLEDDPAPPPTARPAAGAAPIKPVAPAQSAVQPSSKIKLSSDVQHISSKLHRAPNVTHTGACRVKTFIGKVSQQGMEYMDNSINVWLDQHPEIEVKFVTSTFGKLDGKVEHAIITSVWY